MNAKAVAGIFIATLHKLLLFQEEPLSPRRSIRFGSNLKHLLKIQLQDPWDRPAIHRLRAGHFSRSGQSVFSQGLRPLLLRSIPDLDLEECHVARFPRAILWESQKSRAAAM